MHGVSAKDRKKYFSLDNKESKTCAVIVVVPPVSSSPQDVYVTNRTNIELTRKSEQRSLGLKVIAGELVIHLRPKGDGAENLENYPALASLFSESGAAGSLDLKLKRVSRQAILTLGSVQLVARNKKFMKHFESLSKDCPNIVHGIRSLTSITSIGDNKDIIVLCANIEDFHQQKIISHRIAYQSPTPARFLQHVSAVIARGYAGAPSWSIPIQWDLGFSLSPIDPGLIKAAIGLDGGFSHSFYAAVEPLLIKTIDQIHQKLARSNIIKGPGHIFDLIQVGSEKKPWETSAHSIDVRKLVESYDGKEFRPSLIIEAVRCLNFNLTYRSFILKDFKPTTSGYVPPFFWSTLHQALSEMALYNVTLREVVLTGTDLQGAGAMLGKSWGINPHPNISRIALNGCNLSNQDFRGLMPGLLRIWCGRTAFLEKFDLGNNPEVTVLSWNLFFDTLIDPSAFSLWPSPSPPPPPPLNYLQYLDVRGSNVLSSSFATFISQLTGLRCLCIEGGLGTGFHDDDVFRALEYCSSPLESFMGKNLKGGEVLSSALMRHHQTLKKVELDGLSGDVTPLLCCWPQEVQNLTLCLTGDMSFATVLSQSPDKLSSPGTILIERGLRESPFFSEVVSLLCLEGTSTHTLGFRGYSLSELSEAAWNMASNGLRHLEVCRNNSKNVPSSYGASSGVSTFWSMLATSKTLETLSLSEQFYDDNVNSFEYLGDFLKVNRSVRTIRLDEHNFTMTPEGAKRLRSAFYGNRKVVDMDFPDSSKQRAMEKHRRDTQQNIAKVQKNKREIKHIFKSHYSKYNPNWRAKPNQLKVPYVERIRVAQREIGASRREMEKMGRQLDEVGACLQANRAQFIEKTNQKKEAKLERKAPQIEKVAMNKEKVLTKLASKLHKSKMKSRTTKKGVAHIPRSKFYKTGALWKPSYYRPGHYYGHHHWMMTDPYHCRYHYHHGFYGHSWNRDSFLNNDEYHPGESGDESSGSGSGSSSGSEGGSEGGLEDGEEEPDNENTGEDVRDTGEEVENTGEGEGNGEMEDIQGEANFWDDILPPSDELNVIPDDPWHGIDELMEGADSNLDVLFTPEYLSEIHAAAAELGPDVVSEIAPILDQGAAIEEKVASIAETVGADSADISELVNGHMAQDGFNYEDVVGTLGDIPEFAPEESFPGDEDYADEDEAVEMYAGAGPRDLDDGGPTFGESECAVPSGCRRKKRRKKWEARLRQVRANIESNTLPGYARLSFPFNKENCHKSGYDRSMPKPRPWKSGLSDLWSHEASLAQIEVMSESASFPFPEIAESKGTQILEWSAPQTCRPLPIEVVLVTQCSLDRLSNLKEQLKAWKGKASVAVYVKANENMDDSIEAVLSCVEDAKQFATQNNNGSTWDVACVVFQEIYDSSPYPINFLRNMALLQAHKQQILHGSPEKGSVLLVDVDFRPSKNLNEVLHSKEAAKSILEEKKAIICPAFEVQVSAGSEVPVNIEELKHCVEEKRAEGFHQSHFPQGHGPTCFDKYWSLSVKGTGNEWNKTYEVFYEKSFEPYVVMRTCDVPLYDERFQGYGLNKVSHIASIAKSHANSGQGSHGRFHVLPGVFLIAPVHQRSASWHSIYGSSSSDAKYNKLWLKGLYANFNRRLVDGRGPAVSMKTQSLHDDVMQRDAKMKKNILLSNQKGLSKDVDVLTSDTMQNLAENKISAKLVGDALGCAPPSDLAWIQTLPIVFVV